ncbi:hypothetical protein ACFW6V_28380 [Streptomyces sp. NPDC058734]|uniref:hypothetical protein n=1 Tax=Streptomyces sp. NPDC058734 TaxID=3346615 RepID=UPI00369AB788
MSMSEMGGEPAGEESGREAAGRSGEPARPRRRPVGRPLVGWVAEGLAVEALRAVVSAWVPEWADAAVVLAEAAYGAVRGRRGRGGRPRG